MDKLKMQSFDVIGSNVQKIAQLFPHCVTEILNKDGKPQLAIDFEKLQAELSNDIIAEGQERYQFTWPDKRAANRLANTPTTMTLRPCREESVDFVNTQNLYIEGDNLDVLKVLRETYLGKVKMIYIDPPYNTGNDFVYNDDFSKEKEEFEQSSGLLDEEGNQTIDPMQRNTESNGRFHTDWLNMIYPRLKVARDLLSEDGVIFISIDDNEVENLLKVCNEIFGEDNYINTISLKLKNIAGASGGGEDKRLKKNMEFILAYAKDYGSISQFYNVYAYTPISELVEQYRAEGISWKYTTALVDPGYKTYVASTIDGDGLEIKIYKRTDFVIKSISQIMKEERISEKTAYNKYAHCIFQTAMPQSSIRPRVMTKVKEIGFESDIYSIEYVPKTGRNKGILYEQFYKGDNFRLLAWLKDVSEEKDGVLCKKDLQGTLWDFVGETKNLTKEGSVSFPNGKKPVKLIQRMLKMVTSNEEIIIDFFSGSATTAHAVMKLNAEDGGNRKFIMVQLPEKTDEKSEAYKAGYENICEIGKERIRRAGKKVKEEAGEKADKLDIGFRVLKLDSSNMKDVYYTPSQFTIDDLFNENIKPDRTAEDLLFQVMLEHGIELSAKIETKQLNGKHVHFVDDNYLIACFDADVNESTITEIAKLKPIYFVMRDSSANNDNVIDNFEQIFRHYSPETTCKII